MEYFLTSARLGFRYWTADDLPLALELWRDPAVTGLIGGPFSPDAVQSRLTREIEKEKSFGIQYWPVFLLENGRHAGCAGLRPYRQGPKIVELGIHLRPAFWSQGFAEEAARCLMDYAFDYVDAAALFAGHHPDNSGSRKLVQKLGLVYQGDRHYIPTGLMHPTYLLRRDKRSGN